MLNIASFIKTMCYYTTTLNTAFNSKCLKNMLVHNRYLYTTAVFFFFQKTFLRMFLGGNLIKSIPSLLIRLEYFSMAWINKGTTCTLVAPGEDRLNTF